MISIPILAYPLALLFMAIALALAGENTLISAEVLSAVSGASVLSSGFIAIATTAVEMIFASWVSRGDSMSAIASKIKSHPIPTVSRLFAAGLGLAFVYHFDIATTYRHPQFHTENIYFFSVVVGSFVFGPELLLCIGWWLWNKARDEETKLLANTNHKTAENEYRKAQKDRLVAIARSAGKADADTQAAKRWGPGSTADNRPAL